MPTTANLALPYPVLTDTPDVPRDIKALADRIELLLGNAWTAYTPTFAAVTTNPTGWTVTGRYLQAGKLVVAKIKLVATAGFTTGTGIYYVSLPVTAAATYVLNDGVGHGNGANAANRPLIPIIKDVNNVYFVRCSTDGLIDHTGMSAAWATNHTISANCAYEAA